MENTTRPPHQTISQFEAGGLLHFVIDAGRMTAAEFDSHFGPYHTRRYVPAPGTITDAHRVYSQTGKRLTNAELEREFWALTPERAPQNGVYDETRIAGDLCDCSAQDSHFVLLARTSPDVREGGKRYMNCRTCGLRSHL